MNYMKMLGVFALTLGSLVILVATIVSLDRMQLALNPFILGVAALLAGFLSFRKSKEERK